ncbi:MAG: GTPase ObgE [Patescibacteria group bacterium]
MAFADEAKIYVKAGNGGDGLMSFHREKSIAKGGPDGGDGGRGGSIFLVADHNEHSLSRFLRERHIKANHGGQGKPNKSSGKSGEDLFLKVPLGTQVIDIDLNQTKPKEYIIADLNSDAAQFLLAKGGEGGLGNARFARSNYQTPRFAELGEPGEEKEITLRLKMIAEVGIIGLPNAGKSTLLSVISSAKPKIANYAFTTLEPNLGIVDFHGKRFLAADIPGLIEGAHQGKGLGIDFLKHIERTKVLVHIIDATDEDPKQSWRVINNELKKYDVELKNKPQVIVFNKIDAITPEQLAKLKKYKFKHPVFFISAVSHQGLDEVLWATIKQVEAAPKDAGATIKVYTLDDLPSNRFEVGKKKDKYFVKGDKIEKWVIKTDTDNEEAMGRLYKMLRRVGVLAELGKIGAKDGDIIKISSKTIEYKKL